MIERSIFGMLGIASLAGALGFLFLTLDYYFGTGFGLVAWIAVPCILACVWVFARAMQEYIDTFR